MAKKTKRGRPAKKLAKRGRPANKTMAEAPKKRGRPAKVQAEAPKKRGRPSNQESIIATRSIWEGLDSYIQQTIYRAFASTPKSKWAPFTIININGTQLVINTKILASVLGL